METTYEFRRDVGVCLIFTLAFWFITTILIDLLGNHNSAEIIMALLHIIICAVAGIFLHVAPKQKVILAAGLSDGQAQVTTMPKIHIALKAILAFGFSLGLRYLMAPKGTVYIMGVVLSGWR